jgi:hypothetical protein
MKTLNVEAVKNWLRASSLLSTEGQVDLKSFLGPVYVKLPGEAGRKTNLARVLADSFGSTKDGLLWINEYGIWPSSENRLVFYALRRLLGEERPLEEAPGHVFGAEDMELLSALLAVVFYFSWGALLVRGDLGLIARISHDDYVDFYGSADTLEGIGKILTAQRYVGPNEWQGALGSREGDSGRSMA